MLQITDFWLVGQTSRYSIWIRLPWFSPKHTQKENMFTTYLMKIFIYLPSLPNFRYTGNTEIIWNILPLLKKKNKKKNSKPLRLWKENFERKCCRLQWLFFKFPRDNNFLCFLWDRLHKMTQIYRYFCKIIFKVSGPDQQFKKYLPGIIPFSALQ